MLRSEFVGHRRPAPDDAQVFHIALRDLIERRILRASFVATVVGPLIAPRSPLRRCADGQDEQRGAKNAAKHPPWNKAPPFCAITRTASKKRGDRDNLWNFHARYLSHKKAQNPQRSLWESCAFS